MATQDKYAYDFAVESYHRQNNVDDAITHLKNYDFDADFAAAKDSDSPPDFFSYSSNESLDSSDSSE